MQFLEGMIPVWFPALKHLKPEIERAHRIYSGGSPKEGDRLWPFIFCCLRFSIQQAILQEARKQPPTVGNQVLRFTADFSDYTAKHRNGKWLLHVKRAPRLSCYTLPLLRLKLDTPLTSFPHRRTWSSFWITALLRVAPVMLQRTSRWLSSLHRRRRLLWTINPKSGDI